MRVKLQPQKVFTVIGPRCRLEGLRQVGEEWNSMIELRDGDDRVLIVMCQDSRTQRLFADTLFGDGTSNWDIVAGHRDLLAMLKGTDGDVAPDQASTDAAAKQGMPEPTRPAPPMPPASKS